MPVYPSLNLVHVHVPKTAGGALLGVLAPYRPAGRRTLSSRLLRHIPARQDLRTGYFPKHATADYLRRRMGPRTWASYTSFGVIRNPYDSAISHYEFVRQTPTHHRHNRTQNQDFEAFLRSRDVSQARYLIDRNDRVLVTHVVRFENLHEEVNAILQSVGITEGLPPAGRVNTSKKAARDTYLTPSAIALINQRMHKDFELFGYEKLSPSDARPG